MICCGLRYITCFCLCLKEEGSDGSRDKPVEMTEVVTVQPSSRARSSSGGRGSQLGRSLSAASENIDGYVRSGYSTTGYLGDVGSGLGIAGSVASGDTEGVVKGVLGWAFG